MNSKRIRTTVIAGIGALGVLSLSACAADTKSGGGGDDKVVLAEPSWVGASANAAVVKKLMEDELDVKVEAKQMDEPVAFDALDSGKADAILEDWHGVPKKQKKYVEEKKTVVSGGDLGVVGHIGWFVPKYYADKNPDVVKDYKNLNKHYKDFKTSESGDLGHFIGAAPSYSQHDKELIKNLGMKFKHIPSGAEAAQLKELKRLYDAKKPFLTYWWEPQWMNNQIDMVEVKLPKYTKGCEIPASKAKCGYETNQLEKFMNKDFADSDSDAAKFIKNFKWTTKDQNTVAEMIAGKKMDPEDAAAKWIEDNKSTWKKWIPKKK
ncbi:ABC transporter substrate-binding protein [Streptomyces albiaxialis]|uniref:ABC transporter substrate-binding protein n=1 Tax=Streptomyces albiaxialis TaxID=329523 RepID=A0ABP5HLZ0_9ACTN